MLSGRPGAAFRDGQWEAIDHLVNERARLLVIQATGWGKSAVYFIATRMLRDRGFGPTLLISPLLALMRNQVQAAERAGVRAASINSTNRDDWKATERRVATGEVDVLLVSPERLNNSQFRREVLPEVLGAAGLLVVDEAHCISDWGHDFRPDYRRITRVVQQMATDVPVLCTTATANDRVVADITEQIPGKLVTLRGPLERASLRLAVVELPSYVERLVWLDRFLADVPGTGIVYCLTVRDTEVVAGWLAHCGVDAVAYSGATGPAEREEIEGRLLGNAVKVVVATSALGMGFDKPDVSFVVHFQSPGSPIAYYQQVGRAGRAVDESVGVMLKGREDDEILAHFRTTAFPPEERATEVLRFLEQCASPTSLPAIEVGVNIGRTRLEAMLKVLAVEGAVTNDAGGWSRTADPWVYPRERIDAVNRARESERERIVDYAATAACRMQFLRTELDDPSGPCGRCDNCTGRRFDRDLQVADLAKARRYLRGQDVVIEPRRQWPTGVEGFKGRIKPEFQAEHGRALSVYGDGGWGDEVRRAKDGPGQFGEEFVDAAIELVERWKPAIAWVTFVPARRSAVDAFAARVADRLELPLHLVITRTETRPPQQEMHNSAQQLGNVAGAFALAGPLPQGGVLLIDDVSDSRWTLTMVAWLLRQAGSGPVHPFVLAQATGSS